MDPTSAAQAPSPLSEAPVAQDQDQAAVPICPAEAPAPAPQPVTPARVRKFELLLLLAVTIGPSLLAAMFIYFVYGSYTNRPSDPTYVFYGLWIAVARQAGGLALLCYILFRQGRKLRDIGFSFRWRDFPVSFGLFLLSSIAAGLCRHYLKSAYLLWTGRQLERWDGAAALLGTHVSVAVVVFLLINAFYEELIVRAYLMSEIISWKHSALFAGIVSVLVQASYHIYQGVPNMISIGALFSVYAIYYGKTRRVLPVILAHLYVDIYSAAYLFYFHHS